MRNSYLTVAHNIFLTTQERNKLVHEDDTALEVVGYSVPVWIQSNKTSEPAEEIFCKYIISNTFSPETLEITNEGYKVYLTGGNRKNLADYKDRGGESAFITHHKSIIVEDKQIVSMHYISINDMSILLNSLALS